VPGVVIDPAVIVGTGLVGASVGCALSAAGLSVHLRDRVRSHAVVAAGRGAGVVEPVDPASARLVVVAVPPTAVPRVVASSLARYPNAVVTDVGSVKSKILDEVITLTEDASRYIGGHPMAGSHQSGPLTAAAELFADRTWVLTPRPDNPDWVVETARTLVSVCGARIIEMSAADHDRAVAEVSHFPQLVSSLTAARLADVPRGDLRLAGQGVRDVTRIAASDPDMWVQIVAANRAPIREQLVALRDDLSGLIAALDEPEAVNDVLKRGNKGVRALPGKRGKRPDKLVPVVVQIPDAPGALGRLFADIAMNGINIEDLSIEHDPDREIGYLSIDVAPDRVDGLRRMIRDRGWGLRS